MALAKEAVVRDEDHKVFKATTRLTTATTGMGVACRGKVATSPEAMVVEVTSRGEVRF